MVRKISEHIVATLSRRAHAPVPAFNVRLEANLIAEGAPRDEGGAWRRGTQVASNLDLRACAAAASAARRAARERDGDTGVRVAAAERRDPL